MDTNQNGSTKGAIFLPIAGGKGGVGKSVIAANLAIALAQLGFHTVAADLDLGGSNLHSFLGIPNRYAGIGEFIKGENSHLPEFIIPTKVANLHFLPGDGVAPFTANITFHQKQRFITELKKIDADFIILDLGAGSSFNVLDFFALSSRGLVITTPEFPAIITMMSFLKNLLFRNIENTFKNDKNLRPLMNRLFHQPSGDRQLTVPEILKEVNQVEPAAVKTVENIVTSLRPRIIFNMGSHPDELSVIKQFSRGLKTVLSLEADFLGFIFKDPQVAVSVKQRKPVVLTSPQCLAAREIHQIARRLLRFKNQNAPNSAQLLTDSTIHFYNKFSNLSDQYGQ